MNKHAEPIRDEDVPLGDRKNIGFMGTMVARGTGKGVVIRTGMDTEMGKIADLIQNSHRRRQLRHRLEQLGKILIAVSLGLTILVVVAGILHGQPAAGMFLAGVSLAVAAIPRASGHRYDCARPRRARMIKRKAIVRKFRGDAVWLGGRSLEVTGQGMTHGSDRFIGGKPVELRSDQGLRRLLQIRSAFRGDAGLASVICSDKTGTLRSYASLPWRRWQHP